MIILVLGRRHNGCYLLCVFFLYLLSKQAGINRAPARNIILYIIFMIACVMLFVPDREQQMEGGKALIDMNTCALKCGGNTDKEIADMHFMHYVIARIRRKCF